MHQYPYVFVNNCYYFNKYFNYSIWLWIYINLELYMIVICCFSIIVLFYLFDEMDNSFVFSDFYNL